MLVEWFASIVDWFIYDGAYVPHLTLFVLIAILIVLIIKG